MLGPGFQGLDQLPGIVGISHQTFAYKVSIILLMSYACVSHDPPPFYQPGAECLFSTHIM
jgi:hypothetical protein